MMKPIEFNQEKLARDNNQEKQTINIAQSNNNQPKAYLTMQEAAYISTKNQPKSINPSGQLTMTPSLRSSNPSNFLMFQHSDYLKRSNSSNLFDLIANPLQNPEDITFNEENMQGLDHFARIYPISNVRNKFNQVTFLGQHLGPINPQ